MSDVKRVEKLSLETHTFTPIKDWILVRKCWTDQKTSGGFITSIEEEKPLESIVLAVGSECKWVKPGDRLIAYPFSGTTFEELGEKLSLLKEENIWAILDKQR